MAAKTRVAKPKAAKTAKTAKSAKSAPAKAAQLQKDLAENEDEEDDSFVLPSDSENDDDAENGDENDDDGSASDETDSEVAFQDDIISTDATASATASTSSVSGHTIVKPSTQSTIGDKKKGTDGEKTTRGVIYIGRLPSGFEEKELKTYFQQFGEITRLRLSRNKKTGNSKHYAFIEFKELEVAKIAAETMNNYLLMGHLLKVTILSNEQIHERMFIGANRKFKVIPYRKIEQLKNDQKKTREEWEKINNAHLQRVEDKKSKLAAKGVEYDISDL